MTAPIVETSPPARDALENFEHRQIFDWRNCWYPMAFLCDLPRGKPTSVSLYDMPLVLFFDGDDRLNCLQDRCPHRAARLSDGHMIDGRLECLYHGWQFGADGRCLRIPQLLPDKDIPKRSHVRAYPVAIDRGIVWIWAGEAEAADKALLPDTPGGGDQVHAVTFQMDLPYDQSYLIENVIDVAHIHIAHDGVRGGGRREAAKPLEFKLRESSMAGLVSEFRSVGLERAGDTPALKGAIVEFVAPNLVRYTSDYADESLTAGLELYSVPLGKGRCRLLYRKYSNFTSWRERLKPRWMEHQTQCKILEQDMAVVVGQHEEIEREGAALRDVWLPLKSSDQLVLEYRRWFDRYGGDLPHFRGFSTARNSAPELGSEPVKADRSKLHTEICATCASLVGRLNLAVTALWALAAASFAAGTLTTGTVAVVFVALALAALALGAALRRLKARF